MIWALTKTNHEASCNWWVRWWLRLGAGRRFLLCFVATVVYTPLVILLTIATTPREGFFQTGSSPFQFLTILIPLPLLFFAADWLWDFVSTKSEIHNLRGHPSVALATRGEYRGGHPLLPHARFCYLVLGGTLEAPDIKILYPERYGSTDFVVPVLDVEKAKSLLTHVISHDTIFAKTPLFEVEFTSDTGRKEQVEFGGFFQGAEEVYEWRNFIVAIRHQADTGKRPFGPQWKTLPQAPTPTTAVQPVSAVP